MSELAGEVLVNEEYFQFQLSWARPKPPGYAAQIPDLRDELRCIGRTEVLKPIR